MRVRYCPGCTSLLERVHDGTRFVECPEHGKMILQVSGVNE